MNARLTQQINVNVTEAEYARLTAESERAGLRPSQYMRLLMNQNFERQWNGITVDARLVLSELRTFPQDYIDTTAALLARKISPEDFREIRERNRQRREELLEESLRLENGSGSAAHG